ncbi:MAG: exodeoxyribonuclease VII small subunit [Bacteroidales bacterium]|nr:exodeoxyribonuclease VII small subunit [Bacteroidales bacterium]
MSAKFSYEQSLKELESILLELESGQIEIDELFIKVKKATELIKMLNKKLHQTESQVLELLDKNSSDK